MSSKLPLRHLVSFASLLGLLAASAPALAGGLQLDVTVSSDLTPESCGVDDTIAITAGDQVNFCYTVTNQSGETLRYHTLRDDLNGTLLQEFEHELAPGQSFRHNDIRAVTSSQTPVSTWTAATALAGYASAVNDPDRVFADGFDGEDLGPFYAFEDISASGTNLGLDDDGEANVELGFDFDFYGLAGDRLRVGNNGGILFGVAGGDLGYNNLPLPNGGLGAALLPFWDDFDSEAGAVFAHTLGSAPDRRVIVQWHGRVHYNGAQNVDPATFQAVLHENDGRIVFQYRDVDLDGSEWDGGASATIGLNRDGGRAVQHSHNTASVQAGTAIRFTPTQLMRFSAEDTVTITAGTPIIDVTPAALTAAVAAGASIQQTLTIANTGTVDLVWTVDEAGAAAAPMLRGTTAPAGVQADSQAGLAPRMRPTVLDTFDKAPSPTGAAVPAFGLNLHALQGNTFVGLDAANPASVTPIAPITRTLTAGEFVDGDFSRLFALDFDTGQLLTLSTATGSESVIGVAATVNGESWSGLAFDAGNGVLYASSTIPAGSLASTLYRIDPLTAAATPVGAIANGGRIIDIAVSPDGALYGLDIDGDVLVAIDKSSGAGTVVGPIGFNANFGQDMDFDDATGMLYLAAVNDISIFEQPAQMYTIDVTTGQATLVGGISPDPASAQIDAFAIATAGGPCADPADVPWLSLSAVSGTTPPSQSSPVQVGFNAAALTPGDYAATLCVRSNDPERRLVVVPVQLHVN